MCSLVDSCMCPDGGSTHNLGVLDDALSNWAPCWPLGLGGHEGQSAGVSRNLEWPLPHKSPYLCLEHAIKSVGTIVT